MLNLGTKIDNAIVYREVLNKIIYIYIEVLMSLL